MSDNSITINSHNYSPDWEDQEYDDGFIKNRTHGKIVYKCDTKEKVPTSILGARELTDSQETYLQSIGANTESSKELSFVLPGNDVFYDRMSNEYDYDNYEPPNESNTKIKIAIQDSSGIITANPSFTVSEIKTNDIIYGWSFNFTDGGFAENYLKCVVMLLKNVTYNGYIRKGIWLPNYTGSPKKGYACKIEYTCIKKLEKKYIPDLGNSLPDGGTTGQVLTKNSNADGDAGWKEPYTYVLPAATAQTLGGVKIGDGINIAEDGTISAAGGATESDWKVLIDHTVTEEEETNNVLWWNTNGTDVSGNPVNAKEMVIVVYCVSDGKCRMYFQAEKNGTPTNQANYLFSEGASEQYRMLNGNKDNCVIHCTLFDIEDPSNKYSTKKAIQYQGYNPIQNFYSDARKSGWKQNCTIMDGFKMYIALESDQSKGLKTGSIIRGWWR